MIRAFPGRLVALAFIGSASLAVGLSLARSDDKKPDDKKTEETKPKFDPKDVRIGPPPELAALRKAVEDAARKGENVDEIRKQLAALEKALSGKAWVRPKPVEEPKAELPKPGLVPNPGFFPNPPLVFPPGLDPRFMTDRLVMENMQKAQELMLKAILIRGDDPAKAEALMKEARELMGAGGLGRFGNFGMVLPPVQVCPAGTRLGVKVERVALKAATDAKLPDGRGVLVAEVIPGTAAEKAGLKDGDILLEFAGQLVSDDPREFVRMVQKMKAGAKVDITYIRNGKKAEIKDVKLGNLPNPDRLGFGGFGAPMDLPLNPFALPGIGDQKASSVSVRVQDGQFTIRATDDGVKFLMEGAVGDGKKPVPTKIEITDGKKKIEAESMDKVPAEYRDRVQKILDSVSVGR